MHCVTEIRVKTVHSAGGQFSHTSLLYLFPKQMFQMKTTNLTFAQFNLAMSNVSAQWPSSEHGGKDGSQIISKGVDR